MKHGRWPGTWKVVCDVCGFEFASDKVKERWDGLIVCCKDWETRHPQDLIRGIPDNPSVPFSRPEPEPVFIGPVCYIETTLAYAELGTADCMQADNASLPYSNFV